MPLQRTPLHAEHQALGARMVDFGGWEMPVQYSGVKEEHLATRASAGLFDVSHMGEVALRGPGALALIQRLTPNDASRLVPGQVQYSALTTGKGTFVDDILVYRRGEDDFLLVVNASNTAKDLAWIREHAGGEVEIEDLTEATALLAIQGPKAQAILDPLVPGHDLEAIGYYRFLVAEVAGAPGAIVSRTGYTGEDGFEVYLAADKAPALWRDLLAAGEKHGLRPCGLGARDTLRLEARLPLYGNDIDDTTTVIEADLGWVVKPGKGDFLGRDVLAREKAEGARRTLVGFEMTDRGIARHGYPAFVGGESTGSVTSGSYSPSLERNVGLVYLPRGRDAEGTVLEVEVRGKRLGARVVPTPFVPHRTRIARKKPSP